MEKQAILEELQILLQAEDFLTVTRRGNELVRSYYDIVNAEKRAQKEAEEKAAEASEEATTLPVDEAQTKLNSEIETLIEVFKAKRQEAKDAKEREEANNLKAKKELIEEFEKLVKDEENLSKLFNQIKEIRVKWNEIGDIPRDKVEAIQTKYAQLGEEFSYNVGIYKELKENDLKKNFSLKNQVIHKIKELNSQTRIKTIESELRLLQNEWEDIGPTFQEHWENIKEEYWSAVRVLYTKIKDHYEGLRNAQQENLNIKNALIIEVQNLVAELPSNIQEWDKVTKKLTEIQEKWKGTGMAPKPDNDRVLNEFRKLYDHFYGAKKEFFGSMKEVHNEHADAKKRLIESVSKLGESTDWKNTTNKIIQLQKKWKDIGHAGKYQEQKLWKEFRSKCDYFFNKKEAHFKQQDQENETNLVAKEKVISEMKAFKIEKGDKAAINKIKEFSTAFNKIGKVPFKKKDTIHKAYKTELDRLYGELNLDKEAKFKLEFESKLESIKSAADPSKIIRQEQDRIRKRIGDITKEIANYENNLGFFSNAKSAGDLLKGVTSNIEKGKKQIEDLKKQLKSLRDAQV